MPDDDPEDLRDEARRLRERAGEIADDNPTAAEYHAMRADWCDRLARERKRERNDG